MQQPVAKDYYEKRAQEGYGVQYPESHVIRIYEHALKPLLADVKRPVLFDFGCWNGTHMDYFRRKGMAVFGVDIVETAIQQAKRLIPWAGDAHLRVIDDDTPLNGLFAALDKADVVFTNQVLYFLDDKTLAHRLDEFHRMLRPGGLFLATMISRKCFYAAHSTGVDKSTGLERIEFGEKAPERLRGKSASVRFTDSTDQLKAMFSAFPPIQIGRYEFDIDGAHSTDHFIYLGRKA